MDAATKLARQRLSVLELAEILGNVSEACRHRGISRTQFYEYKRRFQTHALEGLKDLPPIPKHHPHTTPPEVVEKIVKLALKHPAWGCNRLESVLRAEGIGVSSVTIQKILNERGLGSRYDRWLALERRHLESGMELSREQIAFIEKHNPCFRERHVESSRPGELLCQDTFYVGRLKGVGRVYLHAVVDTYGSYAFGFLHTSKQAEAAVAVLHNEVLPFYREHGLRVEAILTDNGTEFCGVEGHPYETYLEFNDIEHRRTRVKSPHTNGFVDRFNRTVLEEFFRVVPQERLYESVEALQRDLDGWLEFYNRERPHFGYRNQGRRPYETVLQFVQRNVREEA